MESSAANRNLGIYLCGQGLSNIGTFSQMVALSLLVLEHTESALALGATMSVQALPYVLLSAWAGPLLDRVDLQVPVLPVTRAELVDGRGGEPSSTVRQRVLAARERARARFADQPWTTNAEVPGPALRAEHRVHPDGMAIVLDEVGRGRLTGRGVDRVLRVAWTLADLGGVDQPGAAQVASAVALRGGGLPWVA